MRHASLFSGIGGFDLAAQCMGWENVFQVEIDEFCQKVLEKNFPNVKRYGDIKQFNGTEWAGKIDVLTGGFPCQPYSIAGKRKGTEDSRHLWPQMLRVIGEVQPHWVVGENVSGLLNWDGGLVLKQIKTDLEGKGFTMFPPAVLPACGVNAPHRRDRVWIIAFNSKFKSNGRYGPRESSGTRMEVGRDELGKARWDESPNYPEPSSLNGSNSNNNNKGLQRGAIHGSVSAIRPESGQLTAGLLQPGWQNFPTQSPICRRDDGIPNRVDRIKSLGNAIVPQVAFEIFKAIEQVNYEHRTTHPQTP